MSDRSEIVLSIGETNKLREQLGLNPLKLDDDKRNEHKTAHSSSSFDDEDDNSNDASKKKEKKDLKEIIKEKKKQRIYENITGGQSISEEQKKKELSDEEEDINNPLLWVMKMRKNDKEKEALAAQGKIDAVVYSDDEDDDNEDEDEDESTGLNKRSNGSINKRGSTIGKSNDSNDDVEDDHGIYIDHDITNLKQGKEMILTLKDQCLLDNKGKLNDDDDLLENYEISDALKLKKNIKKKQQKSVYDPLDDDNNGDLDDESTMMTTDILKNMNALNANDNEKIKNIKNNSNSSGDIDDVFDIKKEMKRQRKKKDILSHYDEWEEENCAFSARFKNRTNNDDGKDSDNIEEDKTKGTKFQITNPAEVTIKKADANSNNEMDDINNLSIDKDVYYSGNIHIDLSVLQKYDVGIKTTSAYEKQNNNDSFKTRKKKRKKSKYDENFIYDEDEILNNNNINENDSMYKKNDKQNLNDKDNNGNDHDNDDLISFRNVKNSRKIKEKQRKTGTDFWKNLFNKIGEDGEVIEDDDIDLSLHHASRSRVIQKEVNPQRKNVLEGIEEARKKKKELIEQDEKEKKANKKTYKKSSANDKNKRSNTDEYGGAIKNDAKKENAKPDTRIENIKKDTKDEHDRNETKNDNHIVTDEKKDNDNKNDIEPNCNTFDESRHVHENDSIADLDHYYDFFLEERINQQNRLAKKIESAENKKIEHVKSNQRVAEMIKGLSKSKQGILIKNEREEKLNEENKDVDRYGNGNDDTDNDDGENGDINDKKESKIHLSATTEFCRSVNSESNALPSKNFKEDKSQSDDEGVNDDDEKEKKKKEDSDDDISDIGDTEDEANHIKNIVDQQPIGHGLCDVLKYIHGTTGLEIEKYTKKRGRTDDKPLHKDISGDIKLDYRDEDGNVLTPKEAFRYISWKFHGKRPSLNKQEKKLRQKEMQKRSVTKTPEAFPTMRALLHSQQTQRSSHLVLTGLSSET